MLDRAQRAEGWGRAVRHRRKELGLTQIELAELAGVAVRTVHAVESGKPTVRLDALLAVLSAVGQHLHLSRGSAPGGITTDQPAP